MTGHSDISPTDLAPGRRGLSPMSGDEFDDIRKRLGLSAIELTALLAFLGGGQAPAKSTIRRWKILKVPAEVAALMRVLARTHRRIEDSSTFCYPTLAEHRNNSIADAENGDGAWKAGVLDHLRLGHRLPASILEGVDDNDFLVEVALLDPSLIARFARLT